MPLLPVLALYASYGFWGLAVQLRTGGVRGSAAAAAVLLVAFVGSGGTVEIAARDRSAAQATGVGMGGEVRMLGCSL